MAESPGLFLQLQILIGFLIEAFVSAICWIFPDRLSRLPKPYTIPRDEGNVVITGGTSGLGLESARFMARVGYRVIIVARNLEKAKAVVDSLKEETGNNRIEIVSGDFESFESVRKAAAEINAKNIPIHILMNNAGNSTATKAKTQDGLHPILQSNHVSVQLFTTLLLDRIKEAKPSGRIVTVASLGHRMGKLDFNDLDRSNIKGNLRDFLIYCNTKLFNILFARELQRRLEKEGRKDILSLTLHPGLVATNIPTTKGAKAFFDLVGRSAAQGAKTQLYCALAPAKDLVPGGYYQDMMVHQTSRTAKNQALATKLFEVTEKLYSSK